MPAEFNELVKWPNLQKIDYCGTHIKDRDCKGERTSAPVVENDDNDGQYDINNLCVKVAFSKEPLKIAGFEYDYG
jgi:hypothetical protein